MASMRHILLKTSRAIHALVTRYATQWRIENLIETGTFEGGMIEIQSGIGCDLH